MKLLGKAATIAVPTIAAVVVAGGAATAGSLITSAQIRNGAVHTVDIHNGAVTGPKIADGTITTKDLSPAALAGLTPAQAAAPLAAKPLDGAIYRVANYTNGGGGYATVACGDTDAVSQKYTAISGGAYQARFDGTGHFVDDNNYPAIDQSFPGRMDWSTSKPKPNRLDGWVVKFGGQDATTLQVWALCVPTTAIQVQTTDY